MLKMWSVDLLMWQKQVKKKKKWCWRSSLCCDRYAVTCVKWSEWSVWSIKWCSQTCQVVWSVWHVKWGSQCDMSNDAIGLTHVKWCKWSVWRVMWCEQSVLIVQPDDSIWISTTHCEFIHAWLLHCGLGKFREKWVGGLSFPITKKKKRAEEKPQFFSSLFFFYSSQVARVAWSDLVVTVSL